MRGQRHGQKVLPHRSYPWLKFWVSNGIYINRRHAGRSRWFPTGYGTDPSRDGSENLRFGKVEFPFDKDDVNRILEQDCGFGTGDGKQLASYLYDHRQAATIEAFRERLQKNVSESRQPNRQLGSTRAFRELQALMNQGCDALIYIHGFNVNWWQAVTSALSLQFVLNRNRGDDSAMKQVKVILFTWPSDGRLIPFWSYRSDRGDAELSGYAVGRGFLKLRDHLIETQQIARQQDEEPCRQSIHLLCHSMGNYVLQNALGRIMDFSVGGKLPRIFDQVFLCAADVADDVFEPGKPMRCLPQMAQNITIYHNRGDLVMNASDTTKGNTDRLGWGGADRPADLDSRIHQVDCGGIVSGFLEHSYYHCGRVSDDIRRSIDGVQPDDRDPNRAPIRNGWPNVWRLV